MLNCFALSPSVYKNFITMVFPIHSRSVPESQGHGSKLVKERHGPELCVLGISFSPGTVPGPQNSAGGHRAFENQEHLTGLCAHRTLGSAKALLTSKEIKVSEPCALLTWTHSQDEPSSLWFLWVWSYNLAESREGGAVFLTVQRSDSLRRLQLGCRFSGHSAWVRETYGVHSHPRW